MSDINKIGGSPSIPEDPSSKNPIYNIKSKDLFNSEYKTLPQEGGEGQHTDVAQRAFENILGGE